MKIIRNTFAGLAAISLAATPALAQDSASSTTSTHQKRPHVDKGGWKFIVIGFVAAAVAIVFLASNNEDTPTSP